MAGSDLRDIPRVWEVDWAQPDDPTAAWSSYEWALGHARERGVDLNIVASVYGNFENLRRPVPQTPVIELKAV